MKILNRKIGIGTRVQVCLSQVPVHVYACPGTQSDVIFFGFDCSKNMPYRYCNTLGIIRY